MFFLKDTSADDLRAIIEFMYKGSVNVSQNQLASFIRTAEMLQIRGLSGDDKVGVGAGWVMTWCQGRMSEVDHRRELESCIQMDED